MSNLREQLAYLASGVIGGMILSYLYLDAWAVEDEASDDVRHLAASTQTMGRFNDDKKVRQKVHKEVQYETIPDDASASETRNKEEQQKQQDHHADRPMAKEEEKEESALPPTDDAVSPSADSSDGDIQHRFDRHVGWSAWNTEQNAYDVKKVKSIDECEALCRTDDECHAATFVGSSVGKACGLFRSTSEGAIHGEFNPRAITSVKLPASRNEGRICHVAASRNGKLFTDSAPCYATAEAAADQSLRKAKPLKIFKGMFADTPKKNAFD